ncbi:ExbD/TolR family protein [Thiobaca trueperi]|uniref:Tol-Pal system protein TolR n=1 Tax=Thiobaca trueperi TaxID=127458 RepID=A0A4R3N4Y6_9GAMM|nr:ExbD/TolR family protein [Thiobaca trueperi]TCT23126.1 cell division and transport-associated protein TolR [Thiobaca trueperi]
MVKHSHRRNRRRLMAEINVVPYIDVMLVLLVIFMVTAPLITSGVKVNLPQEKAGAITGPTEDAVVVIVDSARGYRIDVGKDKDLLVSERELYERIRIVLDYKPDTPILVKADNSVDYGTVVRAMVIAQAAGAPEVGLVTVPPGRREP